MLPMRKSVDIILPMSNFYGYYCSIAEFVDIVVVTDVQNCNVFLFSPYV